MRHYKYALLLFFCSAVLSCKEDEETLSCMNDLTLSTSQVTNAICGAPNGSISLSISGAQGTVSYQLNGGASQSDNTFTALGPGTYQILAEDAEGCTASLSVTVEDEEVDMAISTTSINAECGVAEGSITVEAEGGTAPYGYSLDGENFQSENEFVELEPGEYMLTVKDAIGCTTELTAHVNSGISFSARISDIISTNCAVSGCHVAGTGRLNFNEKSNILDNATSIKTRTGSGTMPPSGSGRSLSDAQIEAIACWVDDGASDN